MWDNYHFFKIKKKQTHTSERENNSKTKAYQLNKLEYDHLDNILVFLNTKKTPIKNKFDLKYGKKKIVSLTTKI